MTIYQTVVINPVISYAISGQNLKYSNYLSLINVISKVQLTRYAVTHEKMHVQYYHSGIRSIRIYIVGEPLSCHTYSFVYAPTWAIFLAKPCLCHENLWWIRYAKNINASTELNALHVHMQLSYEIQCELYCILTFSKKPTIFIPCKAVP